LAKRSQDKCWSPDFEAQLNSPDSGTELNSSPKVKVIINSLRDSLRSSITGYLNEVNDPIAIPFARRSAMSVYTIFSGASLSSDDFFYKENWPVEEFYIVHTKKVPNEEIRDEKPIKRSKAFLDPRRT
jgi:hypothetical protein